MSKKKKIIILSCMIALLAVTAVFNFVLTGMNLGGNDTEPVSAANYFSQYRMERMSTRNEELLQLDAIIEAAKARYVAKPKLDVDPSKMTEAEREAKIAEIKKYYGLK